MVQQAGWTVDGEDKGYIQAHRYVQDGDITTLRRENGKFQKKEEEESLWSEILGVELVLERLLDININIPQRPYHFGNGSKKIK